MIDMTMVIALNLLIEDFSLNLKDPNFLKYFLKFINLKLFRITKI